MIVFCHLLNDRSGSPTVLRATLDALDAREVAARHARESGDLALVQVTAGIGVAVEDRGGAAIVVGAMWLLLWNRRRETPDAVGDRASTSDAVDDGDLDPLDVEAE